jgi:hypothetical protein
MKMTNQSRPRLPTEDYSLALRNAVKWLGDRYLLAVPVKARTTAAGEHRFFLESRPWNQQVRRRVV